MRMMTDSSNSINGVAAEKYQHNLPWLGHIQAHWARFWISGRNLRQSWFWRMRQ
jgi:hypothetical protein